MGSSNAKAAVAATRFADLRWVEETGSTNADVLGLLRTRPRNDAPVVLVADHQTAGRGRLQRSWQAPAGSSVLMTIAVPVGHLPAPRRTLLTAALALAVTDERGELTIKWPNDLVVPAEAGDPLGYRKVGGILAEAHDLGPSGVWALLGIGLNVNWPEIPDDLAKIATSLNRVVGHEVDRWDLLVGTLRSLDARWLPLVEDGHIEELFEEYRRRSATLGRKVRVEMPGTELVGVATDVAEDGALVVLDDAGRSHVVTAGDVVHLRPADGGAQGSSTSS